MTYRQKIDERNGILNFKATEPITGYWRYWPSAEFAPYVEHYWTVEWDLPQPELRETLPYPSAHIILEPGVAQIGGVHTARFSRMLQGKSRVLGVKFRPGGLRPFVAQPVAAFTDKVFALHAVFGEAARDLDRRVLVHADHQAAIAEVESFLHGLQPRWDEAIGLVGRIAERIANDRQIKKVEQIVDAFDINMRKLQRLFNEYVGVSPKWMIQRYRLQEAAQLLASATAVEWPAIALDLGYSDQAHFIREFKKLIGKSPAEYFDSLLPLAGEGAGGG
jgi:AraC-like DNA-binding protein